MDSRGSRLTQKRKVPERILNDGSSGGWEGELAETDWVQVSHVRLVGRLSHQNGPSALYITPVHVRDGTRQGVSMGYLHLEGAS